MASRSAVRGGHTERMRTAAPATYSDFWQIPLALRLHLVHGAMSARTPASYDEILRSTVPEPDLSFRPTREEEALSLHRFGVSTEHRPRPLSADELHTLERVRDALIADGTLELHAVELAIEGSTLILLGTVPGPATSVRIEDIAGCVEGVDTIHNELIVLGERE